MPGGSGQSCTEQRWIFERLAEGNLGGHVKVSVKVQWHSQRSQSHSTARVGDLVRPGTSPQASCRAALLERALSKPVG